MPYFPLIAGIAPIELVTILIPSYFLPQTLIALGRHTIVLASPLPLDVVTVRHVAPKCLIFAN